MHYINVLRQKYIYGLQSYIHYLGEKQIQTEDQYETTHVRSYSCRLHSSLCIWWLKFLSSCAAVALLKVWWPVHNPLKWQQPISLIPLPLFPSVHPAISLFPHHPCPTPSQEGGCDWLMYAGVDSDININHLPPSGHWLTPSPQEENGFIILLCSRFLFSGPCCCVHQHASLFLTFQLSKNWEWP